VFLVCVCVNYVALCWHKKEPTYKRRGGGKVRSIGKEVKKKQKGQKGELSWAFVSLCKGSRQNYKLLLYKDIEPVSVCMFSLLVVECETTTIKHNYENRQNKTQKRSVYSKSAAWVLGPYMSFLQCVSKKREREGSPLPRSCCLHTKKCMFEY
jgi:hypothetical protein